MQFPTTDRLSHLRGLMLRTDLLPAEKLICWYLLAELTNSETGLCYCSNQHLAKTLSLNLRTVERCKTSLRSKAVLAWSATGPQTGTSASCYRFIQVRPVHRPVPNDTQTGTPPVHRPGASTGPQTGRTNRKNSELPKNDPATDRRIAAGLAQLAGKLKSGDVNSGAVRAGNAPLIPCTGPADDAAQFQNWKSNYLNR